MRREVYKAKQQLIAADKIADELATVLVGRLRHVRGHTLERLKKELRSFNCQTHQWKER